MNRLLLCLIPLALAACAAAPADKPQEVAQAADPDTICVREARTGSSLPTTKCRTAEQRKAAQAAVIGVEEARRNFLGMTTGK